MTCARRLAGARTPAPSTSAGARRPDARTGRARARRFRLLPVLALLLGALGLFHAAPAQAQTTTFVSNLGQTAGSALATGSTVNAQGFTTGSESGGYTLSSIEAVVAAANATQRETIRAELWSAATGGGPNVKVADLTVPSTVSAGTVAFAAPTNTTLTASTTYYFVLYTVGNFNLEIGSTASDNEDSGGQTGWSIANSSYFINSDEPGTSTWSSDSSLNVRISAKGTVNPPAAPTNLVVGPGNGSLSLSWTAPSGTLTGYDVHYTSALAATVTNSATATGNDPSAAWVDASHTGTTASQTISSLDNGTAYRVRVRAKNSAGNGAWVFGTGTPAVPPPAAPTNLVVTAGNAQLGLTWTAPSGTVTGYDVHYTSANTATVTNSATATGNDPSAAWVAVNRTGTTASQTISSLTNTQAYRVRVRAKNSAGNGAWVFGSGTPAAVAPAMDARLSALTVSSSTSATGTFTSVNLAETFAATTTAYTGSVAGTRTHAKITPTASQSGAAITVRRKGTSGASVTSGSASGALPLTGGANVFEVVVTSTDGTATETYTVTVTRAATFAPFLAAEAREGTAAGLTVQLSAPAPDGGLAITLTPTYGSSLPTATVNSQTVGICGGYTGSRLADGNDVGSGAPTVLTVAAGQTTASVNWPLATDGVVDADECFAVRHTTTAGGWTAAPTAATENNYPEYTKIVAQTNLANIAFGNAATAAARHDLSKAEGSGTVTVPVTVDELPASDQAVNVQVVTTGTDASTATEYVSATDPNDFRIVTKSVTFSSTGGKTQNLSVTLNDDDVQEGAEFIQLRFEAASSDTTVARNYQRNNQARLTIPANDTPPQAPTNLVATPGDTRLDLTWTAPSGTQTGYDVHYTSAAAATVANDAAVQTGAASAGWVAVSRGTENSPPTASQRISSLTNNTLYRVRVRATEGGVVGAWAFGTGTPAPITAPGVPRNVKAVPGNNRVTMTWDAPASWGTYEAEAYALVPSHNTAGGFTNPASATSGTFYCAGSGNQAYACNGATETYRIRARSQKAGSSPPVYLYSAWVDVTVTVGVPGTPTGLTATPGNQKLDLAWTAPSGNSSAVTGYDVHYTSAAVGTVANSAAASGNDPSAAWVAVSRSGAVATQTISSLANDGTIYRWRVRATNGRGTGAWAFGTGQTPIPVSLAVTPTTVVEGQSVTVTATRTVAGPAATIPVTVSTSDPDTAEPGDVGALAGIAFAEDATSATATLMAEHDADTLDETFTVALGSLPNTHVPGSTTSVQVTIDDDDMPSVSLSVDQSRPTEGESVTVTVSLSSPISGAVTIPLTVELGTAESGDVGSLSSITIAAGQTAGTGTIATNHDAGHEDETFTVRLGSTLPTEVLPGSPASVTVTIADDEGNVRVSFARSTMTLCEGGPKKYLPEFVLSREFDGNNAAIWLTGDAGTAERHDHTFLYVGVINMQKATHGWHTSPYAIQANHDGDWEFEEFTVEIDREKLPNGFVAAPDRPTKVTVTIVDDDLYGQDGCNVVPARISVTDDGVHENADRDFMRFVLTLDRAAPTDVTVDYRTVNGTAVAGSDYEDTSGRLTFGHGYRRQEIRVPVFDDNVEDSGETFRLVLSNPQGAVIEKGEATGTIYNDEHRGAEVQLTAAFERAPARHEGSAFWFDLRFKEALGETSNAPSAASFTVKGGRLDRVWKVEGGLWRLRVAPETNRDVTVTLKGGLACDAAGAVCAADGRALSNSPTVTVAAPEGTLSPDADLSALTVEGAPGAAGSWSALDVGTFASATTAYSASVGNAVTHVRLTATASDADATLKAGSGSSLTAVTSGSASAAISLAVGANALKVEVTAEDGTVQTYTVTVTRQAAEAAVAVTLSAAPNPVVEGQSVTVTATLAAALDEAVTVPLTVTRGTSEDGDHGSLASIALPAGFTSATGTITTVADDDRDDETFTVALGSLPSGLSAGTASSVEVTITDSAPQRTAPLTLSGLTGSTSTDGSNFGGTLDIGTFAAATTAYTATVPYGTTHVKLTATAGEAGTTLKAGKGSSLAAVTSGSASGAISLAVGANALTVEVTAADGTVATYTVTVTREERVLSSNANLSALTAEAKADGGWTSLGLGAFAAGTTAYSAKVPNGTTHVRLTATVADAAATLKAGSGSSLAAVNSGAASAAIPLAVGANALKVEVTAEDGTVKTYAVTVEREAPPLTARLQATVQEHDGETPFMVELVLSESLDSGSRWPTAASFDVKAGSVESVRRFRPYRYQVHIRPKSWKDVTVSVAGGRACGEEGAICAADGRSVSNTSTMTVGGPVRIRVEGARAKEGEDASLDFAVTLNRAAGHAVSVDYATADETATAGEDYTATSGTLTFAAGETAKTVSVPVLDDAIDEGREVMRLLLSNPKGAYLRNVHKRARGVIVNDDALQQAWLSRLGRTVGGHVTDAVSGRLEGALAPGAHATFAGQNVDLSSGGDGKALTDVLTGLAQRFGAAGGPASSDDDPFGWPGSGGGPGSAAAGPSSSPVGKAASSTLGADPSAASTTTGRELLLGSSFHLALAGDGAGPGLAAWGRVAHGRFDGEQASDTGRLAIGGDVVTGTLGTDADWGRLLAGVAVSLSEGDGAFDDTGAATGAKGAIESTMTTVSPYARFQMSERVTAWGLAGWGTGDMAIAFEDGTDPVRTDLSMRLGAAGARGDLLRQEGSGGMDLALRADAFFVTTESETAANSAATSADASRLRLVLEGGRSFVLGSGATVRPELELGVRHDGGDAETGTGVEIGGGVSWAAPASGLSLEATARMLVAHADADYEEWGVSAVARLDPGEQGRGLSFSLSPTIGAVSSASERLWGAEDARALAPGAAFDAGRGLKAEAGYGLALPGGLTGTPNLGFGLADGGARDWRLGWRLAPAGGGFELNLDAVRSETATEPGAEHGMMLRAVARW